MSKRIGVLDLQGGVLEHIDHFQCVGVDPVRVKRPTDLPGLAGLVIPGGESTCLSRLLNIFALRDVILNEHRQGMKLWGTCAGAILLATDVVGETPHFGLIDISIMRNAFGSQLDSFNSTAMVPGLSDEAIPLTFIRAPKIVRVGAGVDVLLAQDDYIAAAETDSILVTVFHPELSPSLAFHRYFACKCGLLDRDDEQATGQHERKWSRVSWMKHARIARVG